MVLKEHLANKKILFFSVRTFNLEVEIKNKLEELGAQPNETVVINLSGRGDKDLSTYMKHL